MGKYSRKSLFAAAMLAVPAADAYIVHGHDLLEVCSTDAEVCQAYVVGVLVRIRCQREAYLPATRLQW